MLCTGVLQGGNLLINYNNNCTLVNSQKPQFLFYFHTVFWKVGHYRNSWCLYPTMFIFFYVLLYIFQKNLYGCNFCTYLWPSVLSVSLKKCFFWTLSKLLEHQAYQCSSNMP